MENFQTYKSQTVRDLAWACFGPELIQLPIGVESSTQALPCRPTLSPARLAWLQALDSDPSLLDAHLARLKGQRLGLYFEALWHFFLNHDENIELCAHNLAIREAGTTVGEFDCLYYCRERDVHVHLELAVKFYLGHFKHAQTESTLWLGPNVRDRLDLKLAHLLERQSRLGAHPAAQPPLQALGITHLTREIGLRGFLFHPTTSEEATDATHNEYTNSPPHWLHEQDLPKFLSHAKENGPEETFLVLPRLRWLSPAQRLESDPCLDAQALSEHLRERLNTLQKPALVAALSSEGLETRRFFVVANDWPGRNIDFPGG